MKQKQPRPKRNYLLLGASLLLVGLAVEILSAKVLELDMNVMYKTLLVMIMIGAGYSFAEGIIAPFAKKMLRILQKPFIRFGGKAVGAGLFYIVIYAILFAAYLFIFTKGMDVPWF